MYALLVNADYMQTTSMLHLGNSVNVTHRQPHSLFLFFARLLRNQCNCPFTLVLAEQVRFCGLHRAQTAMSLYFTSHCCPNLRETVPGGLVRPACLQFNPRIVTAQQTRR
jgi:hypothetical protein